MSGPQQAPRAQYGPQQYSGRAGYAPYQQMQHQGQRGPPPNPQVAPMAHQMFHNAARMARHLPHRTDTPMTDLSPPSSDPPSSGSAPDSSNPPTPKDHTSIRVAVDPAFIDPALMDLQSSSSEPVLPAKYFEYADGPLEEQEMEVLHPSVPPSGFVQRVKAMLESKAMVEAAVEGDYEKSSHQALLHNHQMMHHYAMEHDHEEVYDHEEVSELQEFHEMAANETPRFTIIEEFEAPVELPASPVKVPELEAIEVTSAPSTQRITRDIIQAELAPSTTENTLQRTPSPGSSASAGVHQTPQRETQDNPVPSPADLDNQADYDSRKSSPQPVESIHQEDGPVENETVTSVNASLPTGIDYALRFCAPVDTTLSVDETQSKDPFALDADTITFQQQQTKEGSPKIEDHQELQGPPSPELVREPRSKAFSITPISPLRSDEIVKRSSAVSPLHTHTMGIDETMGMGSPDMTMTTNVDGMSETGLYADDTLPPPTPRTPKTYSKSVQLDSNVNGLDHVTTNTNRFSLPGDLSTIGETTMCSASEMVTDIAVRFSLPGTTITVGKPQIVDVSAGSTPDKLRFDFGLPQHTLQNAEPRKRTSSVTFADEVAPLNFQKKQEPLRLQHIPESSSSFKAKSIIRKPSPREDLTESSRTTSRDSTTDLRYAGSNANGMSRGFGSHHLPGLKEESVEDMSLSSRNRSSEIAAFPLPARIAAVKAMQERRLQETADKTKARRQARQYNRSLADTKDLPSLNFSRMDLIDKLNQALDLRTTKSLDVIRRRDFTGIHCPSPQRPLSTEPLRDRYTSFFSKPEDFSFFEDFDDSDAEEQVVEHEHEAEKEEDPNKEMALVPVVQIQEQTEIEGVEPDKRPLSPEDFLSVATQVNRLSIPSVNGLSERLSELIPGLRNLNSLQLDNVLSHDDDYSTHEAHGKELTRPDTVLTNRTSAGFRTLAERAEEIVKNGTHDSLVAAIRALSLNMNKELPALPGSASVDMLAGIPSAIDVKTPYLSGSVSVPTDLHKDPIRPMSAALIRAKTPTTEDEVRRMLPSGLNPIARNARRSMILSHPTSRPWNLDKNFPWSGHQVDVDLSVPDEAHTRESFTKEVFRKHGTKSLDLTSQGDTTGASPGATTIGNLIDSRLESTASLTTIPFTNITPQHLRIPSKRSIIGSISKKFGLSPRGGAVDEDTTLKSLQSKFPVPRVSSAAHSHRAGDRYPTSGLTPPANFHLDEVRSFFSDNSSEHERTASFRKRLTQFKGPKTKAARLGGPRGHSIDIGNTTYDAGSMAEAPLGTNSSANTYDGVGMSKTEFHIKRFGEKLRHLFAKGGDLIRTISTKSRVRGRMDHNQDEWLADSLYSGV